AQELGRDYGGSQFRVFPADFFVYGEQGLINPLLRGNMKYRRDTLEPDFERHMDGTGHLWCKLNQKGRPPAGNYVFGADVSTGLGGAYTSNSALIGIDAQTMEQVFELATNIVPPSDFADLCIAYCKWFGDAHLAWEHGGPGVPFTTRILTQRYPNIYRRKVLWQNSAKQKKEVGWVTDSKTKPVMFDELSRSVRTGELKLRSADLMHECGQYIWHNNKIVHAQTVNTKEEGSKGDQHGDRVIAACVAVQAIRERPILTVASETPGVSSRTMAG
ncbi:unnamed protein product, partial [marine sediment metagenome]